MFQISYTDIPQSFGSRPSVLPLGFSPQRVNSGFSETEKWQWSGLMLKGFILN